MKCLIAAISATFLSVAGVQAAACFDGALTVEAVDFSDAVIEGREVVVELTYDASSEVMSVPLSAVEVTFVLLSDARPLPLYTSTIRDLGAIPGGLFPGEVIRASDFHFMDDRAKALARDAAQFSVELQIEWVEDVDGERFVCASD
ncbi:MAG: hypothetical protein AAF618_04970 [Pseudomonadota bacterium]